ncbi:MAG: acetyl-CoA/propionyl-CoA carboxylase, biotin carboxylase, biotin carboxyl carrier protein [Solirubrobacterales bacterium]|jgi:acetyl-CoA/propionyl-CoA carboxylase biotin carboxyl carrier protein|nr:acetyl-CoA/propionyl-CoA carboxylase, biotin carboxylase, biotin carboxyl carrier protein [Solirubrobacterales bacterium]
MFERVLIANRGEIAARVARTLRRLGVESVAVYSDADAEAPHVRAADRAVHIGPTAPAESYLSIERIVEAARESGAEAIHPGYGFLSERAAFAAACAEAGIVFVGPGPEAIALLGDKVAAKEAAVAAGVPVLPGLQGEKLSDEEILAWAGDEELPAMLKAAAGGGGKGMRIVRTREELAEALGAARREAQGAFGDDRLLVERYVERSRHIEIQVIADGHGNAIHLGERECSLQRRHQKVVEEAPSPVVSPELRERMGAAAVALVGASGYVNAGTVELIAERDDPSSFYFLEVNTRLQVEHPVTEAVTGLDLVELQLRVAAGEELPLSQADVALDGHAIEARVYAEEPARGFLPSTGRIAVYREPEDVRVDSGVEEGTEVGADYDPMLAKVIAHGPDRRAALARIDRGLGEFVLLGPGTNVAYTRALLARPEVRAGETDTGLIERLGDEIAPPPARGDLPRIALLELLGEPASDDPWDALDAWRATGPGTIRAELEVDGESAEVAVDLSTYSPTPVSNSPRVFRDGDAVWLLDGAAEPRRFELRDADEPRVAAAAAGSLESPMPGTVIAVRCAPGDAVAEGDVLVVVESMKMEMAVQSAAAGTVAEVLVEAGERVARGQLLVVLADEEEDA